MEKKIINQFRVKIIKDGKSKWFLSTIWNDGTVTRKELKENV